MTNIKLDSQVMSNIKNENLIAMLNKVIDTELDKELSQVNTSLVEECIDAILQIEQDEDSSFRVLVPLMRSDDFLRSIMPKDAVTPWKRLNVFARVAVVAAIVTTGTFTVNAAVKSVTDYDFIEEITTKISTLFDNKSNTEPHLEFDDVTSQSSTDSNLSTSNNITTNEAQEVTNNSTSTTLYDKEQVLSSTNKTDDIVVVPVTNTSTTNANTTTDISTTTAPSTTQQTTTQHTTTEQSTTELAVEPTTKPTSAQNTTIPPEHIETTVPTGHDPVIETNKVMTGLYVNSNNMKTAYIFGESLNYNGLVLRKLYDDGSSEKLDYRDCKRTTNLDTSKVGDYVVKLEYKNITANISVTVRPNEDTRFSQVCSNDDYDYFLTSKGAVVTKYKGSAKHITLDDVDGNPVYSVEQNMFKNSDIISFSSSSCKRIMDSAFENANDLKTVDIPSCSYIGPRAFRHTAIEEIVIPNGVTEINSYTFDGCESLTKVDLKGSVTKIGKLAFNECPALESITGTKHIKRVEDFAFYDNKQMTLDSTLDNLTYAGENAFAYCNKAVLDTIDNMTYIGDGAFMYCYNITKVHIDSNIDVVPAEAFRGARITTLIIDDGVKAIGNYAFMSTQIKDLVLPNSIKTIGTYAFYTNKIVTVKGAQKAEKVESMAFYPNKKLTMYVLDKSTMYYYAKDNGISYIIEKNNSVIDTQEEV